MSQQSFFVILLFSIFFFFCTQQKEFDTNHAKEEIVKVLLQSKDSINFDKINLLDKEMRTQFIQTKNLPEFFSHVKTMKEIKENFGRWGTKDYTEIDSLLRLLDLENKSNRDKFDIAIYNHEVGLHHLRKLKDKGIPTFLERYELAFSALDTILKEDANFIYNLPKNHIFVKGLVYQDTLNYNRRILDRFIFPLGNQLLKKGESSFAKKVYQLGLKFTSNQNFTYQSILFNQLYIAQHSILDNPQKRDSLFLTDYKKDFDNFGKMLQYSNWLHSVLSTENYQIIIDKMKGNEEEKGLLQFFQSTETLNSQGMEWSSYAHKLVAQAYQLKAYDNIRNYEYEENHEPSDRIKVLDEIIFVPWEVKETSRFLDSANAYLELALTKKVSSRVKAKCLVSQAQNFGFKSLSLVNLDRKESKRLRKKLINKGLESLNRASGFFGAAVSLDDYFNIPRFLNSDITVLEILKEKAELIKMYPYQNSEKNIPNVLSRNRWRDIQFKCYDLYFLQEWEHWKTFSNSEDKLFMQEQSKFIKSQAVDIAYKFYEESNNKKIYFEKALEYSEQSKGILLLDNLAKNESINNIDSIKNKQPISRGKPELIRVESIQENILRPKQALIEYFQSDSYLYIFYVDKDTFLLRRENILHSNLKDSIELFREYFYCDGTSFEDDFKRESNRLYNRILKPIGLKSKKINGLIIIPDGAITRLPFDVLISDTNSINKKYRNQSFLVKDYAVSYCLSISLLEKIEKRIKGGTQMKNKKIIYFSADNNDEIKFSDRTKIFNQCNDEETTLDKLTEGNSLLRKIQKFNGKKIELTKTNLHQYFKEGDICHFFAHGINSRFFCGIIPTLSSNSIHIKDIITIQEITELNFSTRNPIIILLSCSMGDGSYIAGEGLISFSRAFYECGAKGILAPLYDIIQESNNWLTSQFYEYQLGKNLSPDIALQKAKLSMLSGKEQDEFSHPIHWAAMTYHGNSF